jgi:hypothetical protein
MLDEQLRLGLQIHLATVRDLGDLNRQVHETAVDHRSWRDPTYYTTATPVAAKPGYPNETSRRPYDAGVR